MMKAVVKAKAEPGLWLEEVLVPEVRGDDVRISVLKTSICGTDVHIYNWDEWAQKTIPVPMTIGHELVGVVDECQAAQQRKNNRAEKTFPRFLAANVRDHQVPSNDAAG